MRQSQPLSSNYDVTPPFVDDVALVRGLRCGDAHSVEYVLRYHTPALYRFAYYQLRDAALAEDVVSEVMIRMVGRIDTFQLGQGAFQSWLFRIARNLIADHYRACKRRPETSLEQWLEADPAGEPGELDSQIDELFDRQELEGGLAALTCEQREIILLHVVEGWELPQVAELLERSVPSVKGLYYRGIQSLRRALMRDGDYEPQPVPFGRRLDDRTG
jgi:RNA polymerase sigma-70 factor (ECF subfamily)